MNRIAFGKGKYVAVTEGGALKAFYRQGENTPIAEDLTYSDLVVALVDRVIALENLCRSQKELLGGGDRPMMELRAEIAQLQKKNSELESRLRVYFHQDKTGIAREKARTRLEILQEAGEARARAGAPLEFTFANERLDRAEALAMLEGYRGYFIRRGQPVPENTPLPPLADGREDIMNLFKGY